jgi:AcrR family transcriptional regulator
MTQSTKPIRIAEILEAGIALAKRDNYNRITRDALAKRAGCSPALVSAYFGTMVQFRRSLMRHAVDREIVEVVAQGLVDRNPYARKAPDELRQKAMASVTI